ncbi:MAG TPA: glycosyltransferase family 2 protein [Planctomycetota bacterium]|nr:glycosyltransferase family 2 protein [Planctomycetota bacterium]
MASSPGSLLPLPPAVAKLLDAEPLTGCWLPPAFEAGLVSIVVPTFNTGDLIGETLASLLAQTCDRMEVIVVDDGSTDNTQEVLAAWQERFRTDGRFELRGVRQANHGTNSARNLGARASRGEFVGFFDSDDLMAVDRLAAQVRVFNERRPDVVHGPVARFYRARTGYHLVRTKSFNRLGRPAFRAWLRGSPLLLPMCLMSRGFWTASGLSMSGWWAARSAPSTWPDCWAPDHRWSSARAAQYSTGGICGP